jgi:prepilin-type N-terminal cleavage/methylation domain-containing protein
MRIANKVRNEQGFTLLEVLLVVLLLGILSTIGITAFVGTADTKNSSAKMSLSVLRKGIGAAYAITQMRCANPTAAWPPVATLNANDITSGNTAANTPPGTCQTTEVTNAADRKIVNGNIPPNPWGFAKSSTIYACAAGVSCEGSGVNCKSGAAYGATPADDDGWCYNQATGAIWANSENNGSVGGALEYSF